MLIAANADVNRTDKAGVCPLGIAIQSGRDAVTSVLLEAGATLSDEGHKMMTHAMMDACATGNVAEARRLIASRADLDAAPRDGRTVLHVAAARGQTEIVRLLVESGANVDLTDRWGRTALSDAKIEWAASKEMISLLER